MIAAYLAPTTRPETTTVDGAPTTDRAMTVGAAGGGGGATASAEVSGTGDAVRRVSTSHAETIR
jgi:hypothetical protein